MKPAAKLPASSKLVLVRESGNGRVWCRCECGTEREFSKRKVLSGHTKSCGCAKKALCGKARMDVGRWGGLGSRQTFLVWRGMIRRCRDPKSTGYHKYGGRGIAVCERWNVYANFHADMGDVPPGLQIDRHPNNDGDYEPTNCRWATPKQQAQKRRSSHDVTFDGRTQCLKQWSEELGVGCGLLLHRINKHGVAAAFAMPKPKLMGKKLELAYAGKTWSLSGLARELGVSCVTLSSRINKHGLATAVLMPLPNYRNSKRV